MMDTPTTLNSGMCRCCSSEGTFKDIKTKYHWMGEEEIYADMLTDCFDIKILTPEHTDNGICEVCITQLRNAANFKKQVLHTEEQFKRIFCNKDNKNPIKLESADEEPMESDHLSDPDFSGGEYEVPIKEEIEEKPKSKKRTAKATTSRAKKAKSEPESSDQHEFNGAGSKTAIKLEADADTQEVLFSDNLNTAAAVLKRSLDKNSVTSAITPVQKPSTRKNVSVSVAGMSQNKTGRLKPISELHQHMENLQIVMRCSNASPFKYYGIWYFCLFCSSRYRDPATLKAHTLENHRDDKRPSVGGCMSELMIRLDITDLQCDCCGADMESLEQLMQHLAQVHFKILHTNIKSHMVPFIFDSKELRCAICKVQYNSLKFLIEHMNSHFANFICDVCDRAFVNKRSLFIHVARHANGKHKCENCYRVFSTDLNLQLHVKSVHEGKKYNRCNYCDGYFNGIVAKNIHMLKMHGVPLPQLKCPACDKTFTNSKYLAKHTRNFHMMEKRHKCSECEKMFFSTSEVTRHMLTHSGRRDFQCLICSKAYGRKNTLKEHMRIHADDRKFKCELCGMAFVQKCGLKGHMRSKHKGDTFSLKSESQ